MNTIKIIVKRDLLLAFRSLGQVFNPIMFFIIVVTLFPLAIGPETNILRLISPGIIWVAALLATLLSLDSLFRSDYEDGSLEQMLISYRSFSAIVLGKIIAHWLVSGLPLIIVSPLLGVILFLPEKSFGVLLLTLLLGTPTLSLLGAIGMGLTVGLKKGGVLLSLLVLPLYIPVLIIGTMAINDSAAGLDVAGYLYIMAAILVISLTFAPFAAAAAVKISIE